MELLDCMTVARRRWRVIAVVALLIVGLAAASSAVASKHFESNSQFFAPEPADS